MLVREGKKERERDPNRTVLQFSVVFFCCCNSYSKPKTLKRFENGKYSFKNEKNDDRTNKSQERKKHRKLQKETTVKWKQAPNQQIQLTQRKRDTEKAQGNTVNKIKEKKKDPTGFAKNIALKRMQLLFCFLSISFPLFFV